MRGKILQLREAMRGRVTDHHRFLLDHFDRVGGLIGRRGARIAERTAPDAEALALLTTIPGVEQHTTEVLLAEAGPTVDPFPTAGRFASWAGRTTKGNRWPRRAVVQAGWAALHSKRTCRGARYRRVARRRGVRRARMAVGHTPLVIVYQVLRKREVYRELGADYCDRLQPWRPTICSAGSNSSATRSRSKTRRRKTHRLNRGNFHSSAVGVREARFCAGLRSALRPG